MRILIVKLGAVGDVVHTLPSLHSLRKSFPDAYIAWVVEEKSKDVVEGHPDLDELIIFERKKLQKEFKEKGALAVCRHITDFSRQLKAYSFDIAIDFQTLFKSGLITYLSGAKKRIGFDKWRELNRLFTNERVKSDKKHTVDKYLDLVESIGGTPDPTPVKITYSSNDGEYIDDFLADKDLTNKRWVTINPGASWATKLWSCGRYAQLCDRLEERNIPAVIAWGPGEEELVEEIIKKSKSTPIVAPKTSIKRLACMLERSAMYIGGDTGPMHMSVAMGTPVVGIFGPSDPKRNGPYGEGHRVVQADMDCINCWKRKCKSIECMEMITVNNVMNAIEEVYG